MSMRARAGRPILALCAALLCATAALAQSLQPVPPLERRVTDQAGVLDAAARERLESRLAEFERRKGSQVAILIGETTLPEDIEQYSIRVAEEWKLGRKGIDDGALLPHLGSLGLQGRLIFAAADQHDGNAWAVSQ